MDNKAPQNGQDKQSMNDQQNQGQPQSQVQGQTQNQAQAPAGEPQGQQPNNYQNDAVDQANGYGTIGIEEVDMLLMEDEDALDVDNSMYMDTTDGDSDIVLDFSGDVDAGDYAGALDTVDIFVSEYDAMPDTEDQDGDFAEAQDAGASWSGQDPLAAQSNGLDEDGCGCGL